jgi:hypothetical protein
MFTVFYNLTDDLGFSYQKTIRLNSESLARAYVARLRFEGHREAFYRQN